MPAAARSAAQPRCEYDNQSQQARWAGLLGRLHRRRRRLHAPIRTAGTQATLGDDVRLTPARTATECWPRGRRQLRPMRWPAAAAWSQHRSASTSNLTRPRRPGAEQQRQRRSDPRKITWPARWSCRPLACLRYAWIANASTPRRVGVSGAPGGTNVVNARSETAEIQATPGSEADVASPSRPATPCASRPGGPLLPGTTPARLWAAGTSAFQFRRPQHDTDLADACDHRVADRALVTVGAGRPPWRQTRLGRRRRGVRDRRHNDDAGATRSESLGRGRSRQPATARADTGRPDLSIRRFAKRSLAVWAPAPRCYASGSAEHSAIGARVRSATLRFRPRSNVTGASGGRSLGGRASDR